MQTFRARNLRISMWKNFAKTRDFFVEIFQLFWTCFSRATRARFERKLSGSTFIPGAVWCKLFALATCEFRCEKNFAKTRDFLPGRKFSTFLDLFFLAQLARVLNENLVVAHSYLGLHDANFSRSQFANFDVKKLRENARFFGRKFSTFLDLFFSRNSRAFWTKT